MGTLVTQPFPDFTAAAVNGKGDILEKLTLSEQIKGKYGLLFFYPLDFTFVCPSELIALDNRIQQFQDRNVEVLAVSIDSQFTHAAWRNTPTEQGGIGEVKYTLVADVSHKICQQYGVEHPEASVGFRASFIIDKSGIIRVELVNDLPVGRNIDEHLRLIDALQFHEQHGYVCPAGWNKGDAGMQASKEGVSEYLGENANAL